MKFIKNIVNISIILSIIIFINISDLILDTFHVAINLLQYSYNLFIPIITITTNPTTNIAIVFLFH